jgi:hypothetical protein
VNVKDAIEDLAPEPPPCFKGAVEWREYLVSAAKSQVIGRRETVVLIRSDRAINPAFNFCRDCDKAYKRAMQADGRCVPDFLRDTAEATA